MEAMTDLSLDADDEKGSTEAGIGNTETHDASSGRDNNSSGASSSHDMEL